MQLRVVGWREEGDGCRAADLEDHDRTAEGEKDRQRERGRESKTNRETEREKRERERESDYTKRQSSSLLCWSGGGRLGGD